MFTWQVGSGIFYYSFIYDLKINVFLTASQEFLCRDISHTSIEVSDDGISAIGVSIKQMLREMKLEYCIMGKQEVRRFFFRCDNC